MARRRRATEFEVLDIWTSDDGRRGSAFISVPGLRRSVRFEWPGPDGFDGAVCGHPEWDRLSEEERKELGAQLAIAVYLHRRNSTGTALPR